MSSVTPPVSEDVADYVHGVEDELADLPEALRRRVLGDLERHLGEIGSDAGALESQLGTPGNYARELRAAWDLPPLWPTAGPLRGFRSGRSTMRLVMLVAAILIIAAAGVAIAVASSGKSKPPVATGRSHAPSPAKPPTLVDQLLARLPKSSNVVVVGSGTSGGSTWTYYAKISQPRPGFPPYQPLFARAPNGFPLTFRPGICTAWQSSVIHETSALAGGGSNGPCLTASTTPHIDLETNTTTTGETLLMGVIPMQVPQVRIEFATSPTPVLVNTVTTDQIPGVSFFCVQITRKVATVVGLDPSGTVVIAANPATPIPGTGNLLH